MTAEIDVLQPGLFSTIQDPGRFGFREYGVPLSGPMDSYAYRLANLILQNDPQNPVLEITQIGPKLLFNAPASIVITGGNLSPAINGSGISNNRIHRLAANDILSFGRQVLGSRAYLAIKGGFSSSKVLNSFSWYEGLTPYFRLEKGMTLSFLKDDREDLKSTSSLGYRDNYLKEYKIPVFPGPEFEKLPTRLRSKIFSNPFTIAPSSNRMAFQFLEDFENDLLPMLTGPVIPGTIQLTPSGKLIVLMRDCQTTGGYPRVLQVSEKGVNILSQKMIGEKVKFELIKE